MKILLITSTRIGDAVLSTGVVNHLHVIYPDAKITVAVGYLAAPLFNSLPSVERVIPIRKQVWELHWLRLWIQTVGVPWDLVIDLRGSALSWLLMAKDRKVLRKSLPGEHRVETLGRILDVSPAPPPRLVLGQAAKEKAETILGPGPVIGLGVTANWLPKIWPADNFITLSRLLIDPGGPMSGARIAIFGGPGEENIALPILEALGEQTINLVGWLEIQDVAACLGRCNVFVGNDSGLMHMAAALDIPTVGLFGPSPPERYRPWGTKARAVSGTISYADLVNDPDFDHRADNNLMMGLGVGPVFEAIVDLISQPEGGDYSE
jgi:heptosyltransferase-3